MEITLGKKVVDQKQIEDLEAKAGSIRRIIESREEIAKGGAEGVKAAIKYFKEYRDDVRALQMRCYYQTNHAKMLRALEYAGEINGLNVVIDALENPKESAFNYRTQLDSYERTINEWKKLPRR